MAGYADVATQMTPAPGVSMLYLEYQVEGASVAALGITYAVEASPVETAALDVAYEVAEPQVDEWEPTACPISPVTQRVGNKFPLWHAARRRPGSTAQRLLNVLSCGLEEAAVEVARLRASRFLMSADLQASDRIFVTVPPRMPRDPRRTNLLRNADFSRLGPAVLGTPWGWRRCGEATSASLTPSRDGTLFGSHRVRVTAAAGEVCVLRQDVLLADVPESLCARLYYAGMAPAADAEPNRLRLMLLVELNDGSVQVEQVGLKPGTDGAWEVADVTVLPRAPVYRTGLAVVVDNRDGASAVTLDLGAAHLERGDSISSWSPHTDEGGVTLVASATTRDETVDGQPLSFRRADTTSLQMVESAARMIDALPSHGSWRAAGASEVATSASRLGETVDMDGRRFTMGWRAQGGLAVQYNADLVMDEAYTSYEIASLGLDEDYDEPRYKLPSDLGVTQVVEALTVHRRLLWVVVLETIGGRTTRSLKVVSPGLRWDDTGALEALAEVEIPVASGSCTFAGFLDSDPEGLLVTIDGADYVLEMLYETAALLPSALLATRSGLSGKAVAR